MFYFCVFVCLLVCCTSRFANFAKGKWSNHDSKNCSEIKTVTWSIIWLWKLQFTILIFFTFGNAESQSQLIEPSIQNHIRVFRLFVFTRMQICLSQIWSNIAKYGYWSAYFRPAKYGRDHVQRHWPIVNRTPQSKVRTKSNFCLISPL